MTQAFQKGCLLLQQGRTDLAEREFRQALAESPDSALAHAYLALCLGERGAHEDALREAAEAVRLDPSEAFHHYALGVALWRNNRLREADAAAKHAIQLEPFDADYFGLLSAINTQRKQWKEALEAADQGLAIDPQHAWSTNLRAMALVHLGRGADAARTLESALAENPENEFTHANQGWAHLHAGDHKKALEHFRESLRLAPDNEWARAGLKESLKARYPFYRVVLGFSLWLSRQARWAQIGVLIAVIFGPRVLREVAEAYPRLSPFLMPIAVLGTAFILLTWVAEPLSNFLLQFHPLGRLALTRRERWEASVVGSLFVAALAAIILHFARGSFKALLFAMFFGGLIFPIHACFRLKSKGLQLALGAGVLVLIYLAAPLLILPDDVDLPKTQVQSAISSWNMFLNGVVLSSWIPMLAASRGWARE
jgi:tetratricopeptide (TPR) repeat protein